MQNKMAGLYFLPVPQSYSEKKDVHTLQISPPIPCMKHLTTEQKQLPKLQMTLEFAHCWQVQYTFSESNAETTLKEEVIHVP